MFRLGILISTLIFILATLAKDREREIYMHRLRDRVRYHSYRGECIIPEMPVYPEELMQYVQKRGPLRCGPEEDWVTCVNSVCKIKDCVKRSKGKIACSFRDVIRRSETRVYHSHFYTIASSYTLKNSDIVKVHCVSSDMQVWTSILTSIRNDKKLYNSLGHNNFSTGMKLNVLVLGFDSTSRSGFKRNLPKTYEYLINRLQARVLKGYNIIGAGTPQALEPMLTGFYELELPDTRTRIKYTSHLDYFPFAWRNYKAAGYVTAYVEDCPDMGTFNMRQRGFKNPPTDHYMRTYFVAIKSLLDQWNPLCSGSVGRHKVMLDYMKDFFTVYKNKPKFLFSIHGELPHDHFNLLQMADDDIRNFLEYLHRSGTMNDTILIVMTDHGYRFRFINWYLQAKIEERLPFFSFSFPPWFKTVHKELYDNFMSNIERLVTPFDIHATFMDILHLDSNRVANLKNREISLFKKIPKERSCRDAFIEPQWCTCLEPTIVSRTSYVSKKMATLLVRELGKIVRTKQQSCANFRVKSIRWIKLWRPNRALARYDRVTDVDGFKPAFAEEVPNNRLKYEMRVILSPGNFEFNTFGTHYVLQSLLHMDWKDIKRIDKNLEHTSCLDDIYANLTLYCYCIKSNYNNSTLL